MAPVTSKAPVEREERILSLPLVPGGLHPPSAYATAEGHKSGPKTGNCPYATLDGPACTTEREWLWHPKNIGWADTAYASRVGTSPVLTKGTCEPQGSGTPRPED